MKNGDYGIGSLVIFKWKDDRAKLEELRKWRSKKEDDEKAKRKGLVVDKKSING